MATTTQIAKAQQMLDTIRAGKTSFHKSGSEWVVVGPAAVIRPGATVTVTKADGTTTRVEISQLTIAGEKQGVAYQLATFHKVPAYRTAQATDAPATDAQVDYALDLLARRERSGDQGGWMTFSKGHPTREQLAAMTAAEISSLITGMRDSFDS